MEVLAEPLTHIINTSITSGIVPEHWKEAVVVPILKKGSSTDVNNYRPVSCFVAASKSLGENCMQPGNTVYGSKWTAP